MLAGGTHSHGDGVVLPAKETVSSDFLMNGTSQELAGGMLADKELLNQFRFIEQLPDTDKSVVKVFLDAFITKRQLQTLAL